MDHRPKSETKNHKSSKRKYIKSLCDFGLRTRKTYQQTWFLLFTREFKMESVRIDYPIPNRIHLQILITDRNKSLEIFWFSINKDSALNLISFFSLSFLLTSLG